MSRAYVDSSCIVASVLNEPGAATVGAALRHHATRYSSSLLEAEVRSAARREAVEFRADWFEGIEWLLPDRPLHEETAEVIEAGYLRGADVWHLACALFIAGDVRDDLAFLTLDRRQAEVAAALGLSVPDLVAT